VKLGSDTAHRNNRTSRSRTLTADYLGSLDHWRFAQFQSILVGKCTEHRSVEAVNIVVQSHGQASHPTDIVRPLRSKPCQAQSRTAT